MGTTLSRALAPRAFGLLSAMVIGAFILPLGLTLMGALMNVLLLPLGIGMRGVAIVAAAASSPPPVLTDVPAGNVQILDRHGELLYEFAGPVGGFHYAVPLEGISDHLVNATIATEDASFWHNPGINPRGLLRAAFENLAF